jgi:hypothetical protein
MSDADKKIWSAIVCVTDDRIQEAEKNGQWRKADRLRELVQILKDKK